MQILTWLFSVLGLDLGTPWVAALHFFLYDSLKILILLFVMISIVGFLRSYIPQQKVKSWITNKPYGSGHVMASLFGAVTPFCSCSSIPLFIGFLEAGVPLGITFSFLITSPLVNEYLVVLMLGFFGWKITLAYVLSGILIGIISGFILGKLRLEKYLVKDLGSGKEMKEKRYTSLGERIRFGVHEAVAIIKKLWVWILVGVGVGAIIHNYVPTALIESLIDKGGFLAVPFAVLLGVPMYGSCAAIVPIAVALFNKGVPLGTALAFMMAMAALSFPEAVILRRAMHLKLIGIFFLVVTCAIIVTGYVFNILGL